MRPLDSTLDFGDSAPQDRALAFFSAYLLPALMVALSLWALWTWPAQYPSRPGVVLPLQVLQDQTASLTPAPALQALKDSPAVSRYDTRLSEHPHWWRIDPPASVGAGSAIEFPSRHATELRCWNAETLQPLGEARRGAASATGDLQPAKSGFVLALREPTPTLLCQGRFVGPARLSAQLWPANELAVSVLDFHRNAGLLEGGLLVLAALVTITAVINRNTTYLLFAAWVVVNLRMAGLSAGWDTHWLGHAIPVDWLTPMRALTLALYYVVTFSLFRQLFREELRAVGYPRLIQLALWTCWPLPALALALPYAQFLPVIWACTGLGVAILVFLLGQILHKTRSRVAMWYAGSIAVALFASLYEVIAAALGLQGLIGSVNSVTAALASSLMAAMAIAEQIRLEHMQRLQAQAELEHTFDAVPVGLFTLDLQGRFNSGNRALLTMLQAPVLNTDWTSHFGPNAWSRLHRELMRQQQVELEIEAIRVPDGQPLARYLVQATLTRERIEGSLQDITAKSRATENLQFLALHDPLTKVFNRRGIEEAMQQAMADTTSADSVCLAYLDLDRFKLINDLYGHAAGDEVLQQVCERAAKLLSGHMRMGRVGGDEFVILMPRTPIALAQVIARAVVDGIGSSAYQVGERAFHVRGSIGLIEVGAQTSMKEALSTADRACREAKIHPQHHGLVVYEKNAQAFLEHEAELRLVERLSRNEQIDGLFLEMQPIMSLRDPKASLNFEVLLRMHDAEGRRVPTERLIKAGENSGRMGVIDRWVLSNTLEWLQTHGAGLNNNQFVCMNLSGASLNDERFMQDVFAMLDAHRAIAHRLCLEVTESVALHDLGNTKRFIERTRGYGTKVALDDFGAGYTSFSYLKDLPADLLKIDGSFIVNMNRHPANVAIVEAIVSLAQNLGMKTIAEWAEDNETVETLAEIGVDYVQGFVVARPQTPSNLLTVQSSAGFIRDEQLLGYVNRLALKHGGLPDVDLFLGGAAVQDADGSEPPPLQTVGSSPT